MNKPTTITRPHEQVYIDVEEPIEDELFEPEPEPAIPGFSLTYAERTEISRKVQFLGFCKGTVVVLKAENQWGRVDPANWGVILDTPVWDYDYNAKMFAPIKVQWVKDGGITHTWPEKVVMIHPAPDSADLELIKTED
jgi:hypothetical protein